MAPSDPPKTPRRGDNISDPAVQRSIFSPKQLGGAGSMNNYNSNPSNASSRPALRVELMDNTDFDSDAVINRLKTDRVNDDWVVACAAAFETSPGLYAAREKLQLIAKAAKDGKKTEANMYDSLVRHILLQVLERSLTSSYSTSRRLSSIT